MTGDRPISRTRQLVTGWRRRSSPVSRNSGFSATHSHAKGPCQRRRRKGRGSERHDTLPVHDDRAAEYSLACLCAGFAAGSGSGEQAARRRRLRAAADRFRAATTSNPGACPPRDGATRRRQIVTLRNWRTSFISLVFGVRPHDLSIFFSLGTVLPGTQSILIPPTCRNCELSRLRSCVLSSVRWVALFFLFPPLSARSAIPRRRH
ncbi:hypothetical protein ISCGN_003393 [Ixodes scapularis]